MLVAAARPKLIRMLCAYACTPARHSGSHLLAVLAVASVALPPHHPCLPATPPPCRLALRPGIHSNGGLLLRPGAPPPLLMSLRGGSEEKHGMGSADGADLDQSEVDLLLADAEHFCACTGAAQPNVVRVGIGGMHACATAYMQCCKEGPTPKRLHKCLPILARPPRTHVCARYRRARER